MSRQFQPPIPPDPAASQPVAGWSRSDVSPPPPPPITPPITPQITQSNATVPPPPLALPDQAITHSVAPASVPGRRAGAPKTAPPLMSLPPVGRPAKAGSSAAASGRSAVDSAAELRSRVALIKRRKERKWQWLRKLPGYEQLESLWLRIAEVRDAGDVNSEEERKRELPAWMVSFFVHLALLLTLALIPLAGMMNNKLEMIVGDFNGEGAIEFSVAPEGTDISLQEIDLPMSNIVMNTPEVDLSLPSITNSLTPARASDSLAENLAGLSVEQGLAGRSGSMKGALLSKFGGNASTEAAVAAGLKWLVKNQRSDGGWSLQGPYSDPGINEDRAAATSMALNAFLGAGHTHQSGDYQTVVRRGLAFLLKLQDKEGFFGSDSPEHNQAYSQALATITVCEAYGMTHDSNWLRTPAHNAIKYAQWSQGRQKGWRYVPRGDSDLSVTGWYLMALMTGRMAGIDSSDEVIKSVEQFVESVSHDYGSSYSYQRADPPSLSMTAEGLLCRQYLGWPRSHPSLQKAIQLHLLENLPEQDQDLYSVYYWYYATQVLHHVGGKEWQKWNDRMKVTLPAMQVKKGNEEGSWFFEDDQFGKASGRLYATCFCIYCLEVYYRHLAIYDSNEATIKRRKAPAAAEEAATKSSDE